MTLSGPTYRSRVWLLVLLAAVAMLGAPRWAIAGCHLPGQVSSPAPLSWERDPLLGSSAPPATAAPLILRSTHCPSEVPHVVDSSVAPIGFALLDRAWVVTDGISQPLAWPSPRQHPQPPVCRFDRPPRRFPRA